MKHVYYLLFLGPRGYGKPASKDKLESQYQQGDFESLRSIDEMAHYFVIAGYVHYIHKSPTILDVGCGQGHLLEILSAFSFESYLGIDLSPTAIKNAESLRIRNARFEEGNFEEWVASGRFDIIIFNESLVYSKRPVDVLLRYGRWLDKNGSIIISMFRYGYHRAIWKSLDKYTTVSDSTTVRNAKGKVWDVRVVNPKPCDLGLRGPMKTTGTQPELTDKVYMYSHTHTSVTPFLSPN